MDYVPGTADVQVGDTIMTSGIDGIYPKGFVVGQIESIERGGGEFTGIVIRPAVDFSALEAVLVVLSPPAAADADVDAAPAGEAAAQDRE
jgi:rod shape-determining protein MreC